MKLAALTAVFHLPGFPDAPAVLREIVSAKIGKCHNSDTTYFAGAVLQGTPLRRVTKLPFPSTRPSSLPSLYR